MKNLLIMFSISLISCGGSSTPPFEYTDNSRLVIEAVLQNESGDILQNQKIEVYPSYGSNGSPIKTVFADSSGKIFLSIPFGNYAYSIYFSGKKIVSMQRNQELILFDTNTNENSGGLINFSQTYYDLGIVELINK